MQFKNLKGTKLKITEDEVSKMIPLWRDKHEHYNLLEHMFGSIEGGCAVGQTCFGNFKEPKPRFYSTATIQDSFVLSLHRKDIQDAIDRQAKRELDLRYWFLKEIPEFKHLSRAVLLRICGFLEPFTCIKGSVIFNMGDPFKYIYFIQKGEFQQTVKVAFKNKVSSEDPSELLNKQGEYKKPTKQASKQKEIKQHKMSILGQQKVVGLDELSRQDETYSTTLVCLGGGEEMKGELFRIEKDIFLSKVAN